MSIFISLEGIEGAGKSTQAPFIAQWFNKRQQLTLLTHEPGGTQTGTKIRKILLEETGDQLAAETELLLMFADRAQHVLEVIQPALVAGKVVISDRFTDASYAYQGGGRGLTITQIQILEDFVHKGLQPDLTLLFDVDVAIGLQRIKQRLVPDRFESEPSDFFQRIRKAYMQRAKAQPSRFYIIDANVSQEEVSAQIDACLTERFVR